MKYVMSIASCTSPRVSVSTLPISCVIRRARFSFSLTSISAARNRISARRGAGYFLHFSNALLAASTAAVISSGPDLGTTPKTSTFREAKMTELSKKRNVWKLPLHFSLDFYKLTANFPAVERYGLMSRIRRAAVAIPTNIAEGNARGSRREYLQYCHIARASVAEVEYLLRLCLDLGLIKANEYAALSERYGQVGRMLQGLINKLASI